MGFDSLVTVLYGVAGGDYKSSLHPDETNESDVREIRVKNVCPDERY